MTDEELALRDKQRMAFLEKLEEETYGKEERFVHRDDIGDLLSFSEAITRDICHWLHGEKWIDYGKKVVKSSGRTSYARGTGRRVTDEHLVAVGHKGRKILEANQRAAKAISEQKDRDKP